MYVHIFDKVLDDASFTKLLEPNMDEFDSSIS